MYTGGDDSDANDNIGDEYDDCEQMKMVMKVRCWCEDKDDENYGDDGNDSRQTIIINYS